MTYTIKVTNNGTSPVKNMDVKDTVPANTTLITVIDAAGGEHVVNGSNITWTIPEIASHQTVTVSFQVKIGDSVPVGTIITNKATVVGGGSDGSDVNTNTVTTNVIKTPKTGNPVEIWPAVVAGFCILGIVSAAIVIKKSKKKAS